MLRGSAVNVLPLVALCLVSVRTAITGAETSSAIAPQASASSNSNYRHLGQHEQTAGRRSAPPSRSWSYHVSTEPQARATHSDERDESDANPQQQQWQRQQRQQRRRGGTESGAGGSNGPLEEEKPSTTTTTTENSPSDLTIANSSPPLAKECSPSLGAGSGGSRGGHGDGDGGGGSGPSFSTSHGAVHGGQGSEQQQQQEIAIPARNAGLEISSPSAVPKVERAWERARLVAGRALHVRREIKAMFSSELERCLLKATRPENLSVDEACVQALLAQANRLAAVQARFDCDPHEVVCSKLFKKMMEKDWRTVAKALYVVHRLQRDSPPKDAARFCAFFKERWADGAGELGRHMRTEGGENAPWLKVYSGYLAARGRGMETAQNAFGSWETLTSMRQLRNGLAEANALLARALALHFADDASSPLLGGGNVRRACCALAFQDVACVRAMVGGTGRPPALLGIPGLEDAGYEAEESSVGRPMGEKDSMIDAAAGIGEPSMGWKRKEAQGVTTAAVVDCSSQGASARDGEGTVQDGKGATASDRSSSCSETLAATYAAEAGTDGVEVAAGAAREDDTVAAAAKECAAYEEVSGVITAVYSARYDSEARGSAPAIPLWVRQLADLERRAGVDAQHHQP